MRFSPQINQNGIELPIGVEDLPERALLCVSKLQSRIADYLFEMRGLDGIGDFRSSRNLPRGFIRLFRRAMNLYDESVRFLLAHFRRRGAIVKCKPGCPYCCYHMPAGLSTVELLYMYYGMHQSGRLPIFFRRCLEAQEVWTDLLLQCKIHNASVRTPDSFRNALLTQYQLLNHPCPFLQQDSCQIYPYRPFACRMHFSISPPHWCRPSHFQFPYAIRFSLEPGECVLDGMDRLDDHLQIGLSDILVTGLLELTVNIMQFEPIGLTI